MGFFSPNSSDSSRGNIFTRIKDTTGSLLDAFVDTFIKSTNGDGKEVVEVDSSKIKLNEEQIQVKTSRDMPLNDFLMQNLKDWQRPMPDAIRHFTSAVMFQERAESESTLAIRIGDYYFNGWKNNDFGTNFDIVSKYSTVGELAGSLRESPAIVDQLKEIGFEINDHNLVNLAMFHEMGHLACFLQTENSDEMNAWSEFDDKLYDAFLSSVVSKEMADKEDVTQEEWSELQSAFYRELPMEHYSDEFAKFCMQEIFEPNGDFKSEIDKDAEIPVFEVRHTLEDYNDIFIDLMFGEEYDGPDNLAEIYSENGEIGLLVKTVGEDAELSFGEAFSFNQFAEKFDEIQEVLDYQTETYNPEDYEQKEEWERDEGEVPPEVVLGPEDVSSWDSLGDDEESVPEPIVVGEGATKEWNDL